MRKQRNTKGAQYLLLKDIRGLGRAGEIVAPKAGFVRNFLLPKGFLLPASPATVKLQKELQEKRAKQAAQDRADAESLARELEGKEVIAVAKTDVAGRLYGSVSTKDLAVLIEEQQDLQVDRRDIILPHGIKSLGSYKVTLKLMEGVTVDMQLTVIPEK